MEETYKPPGGHTASGTGAVGEDSRCDSVPDGVDPDTGEIIAARRRCPHPDAPPLNAAGKPWTSIGRRNMSADRTRGLGNGGVTPPHGYERRSEPLWSCEYNDAMYLYDWRAVVGLAVTYGWISKSCAQMLQNGLASFAGPTGHHVWPSQAAIGDRCDLSAGRVCHLIPEAIAAGLVRARRQSEVVGPGTTSATSNTYEFCFPLELVEAAQMHRRLKAERKRRNARHVARSHRPVLQKRRNPRRKMTPVEAERRARQKELEQAAAETRMVSATFDEARRELERRLEGAPAADVAYAMDALERRWVARE